MAEWLNYHHLQYFWAVARDGGLAPAAERLRLSQQTLSGQIRVLEGMLGEKLFEKRGRRLALTEMGRLAYGYADEIFGLGRELVDTMKGQRAPSRATPLNVGIAQVMPKLLARRLLDPLLEGVDAVRLVCREDQADRLLGGLVTHELDAILADAPVSVAGTHPVNHLLGECGVAFFARGALATRVRRDFPASLDGEPLLMPSVGSAVRHMIDAWLEGLGVKPRIVAEFDDSALLKAFGEGGRGVFPGPAAIADEIRQQYRCNEVGRTDAVRERFYLVTLRRRVEHQALRSLVERARHEVFAPTRRTKPAAARRKRAAGT